MILTTKELYKKTNIIREGHFELSNGLHSKYYIDKNLIYSSEYFKKTIWEIAKLCNDFIDFDIVTGTAISGAILAAPVFLELNQNYKHDIRFIYSEKINNEIDFKRGYNKCIEGKKILIIKDLITTGYDIIKIATSIKLYGGSIKGVVCIWNKNNWKFPDKSNIKIKSVIDEVDEEWEVNTCPLCKEGNIPIIKSK